MPARAALTLLAALSLLTLTGCLPTGTSSSGASTGATAGNLAADDPNAPMPAAGACHITQEDGQELPDPRCTPGAINPKVTQADIGSTICVSGWTKTVRPPTSVTNKMKKESDQSYGLSTGTSGEYDHLISLELGGAPDDPRNLWIEPGKIPNPKDTVENRLSAAVCSNLIPLATAQQAIAGNWPKALQTAGLTTSGTVCLLAQPARCAGKKGGDND